MTPRALTAAGLTTDEVAAIELLATPPAPHGSSVLRRVRPLSQAPGPAGYLARVVARAAIEDWLDGARPDGETLTALRILPERGLKR